MIKMKVIQYYFDLYETAVFYIREIDKNIINEFCLNVTELNKIEY